MLIYAFIWQLGTIFYQLYLLAQAVYWFHLQSIIHLCSFRQVLFLEICSCLQESYLAIRCILQSKSQDSWGFSLNLRSQSVQLLRNSDLQGLGIDSNSEQEVFFRLGQIFPYEDLLTSHSIFFHLRLRYNLHLHLQISPFFSLRLIAFLFPSSSVWKYIYFKVICLNFKPFQYQFPHLSFFSIFTLIPSCFSPRQVRLSQTIAQPLALISYPILYRRSSPPYSFSYLGLPFQPGSLLGRKAKKDC